MANKTAHQLTAALVIGSVCLKAESSQEQMSAKPLFGAVLGATLTNLPDVLEPALHPNHRQFFHSVAFASLIGIAAYKTYRWAPDNQLDRAIRFVLLAGLGAYAVHLALDATTPKSLPLFGKL